MRQIRKIIIIVIHDFLREREVFDQNAHKITNSFISNGQSDAEIDRVHSGLSLIAIRIVVLVKLMHPFALVIKKDIK